MNIHMLTTGIALGVASALGIVTAQERTPAWRAGLYVSFPEIAARVYGEPAQASGLFLEGEPLAVEIGILNPYGDREVAAERNWPELASVTIRPGSLHDTASRPTSELRCAAEPVHSSNARADGLLVVLPPMARQRYTCTVDPVASQMTSGVYTVTIVWKSTPDRQLLQEPQRVTPGPGNLGGSMDFEWRALRSTADRADLGLRLAWRALRQNVLSLAEQRVEEVLALYPLSSQALVIRSQLFERRGACRAAQNDLRRAADIIGAALDRDDKSSGHRTTQQRGEIAERWRREAEQLRCR